MTNNKYFGTDGIRGRVGSSMINPEFVLKLGWAVGSVLGLGSKVLIGKDTRISGYLLESLLEAGLSAAGVTTNLLGPMPTPAVAYLTRAFRVNAGIVISASHNPYSDNGIKFFSAEGTKLPSSIEAAIEKQMDKPLLMVDAAHLGKAHRIDDAAGRYIEFCKSTLGINRNLNGLKIIVDCANGATYHIAPFVFKELGAEVLEIGTEPDGFNINQNCGSTHPETLAKIVNAEQADLGIAFDGDGDRVIMVDHKGEIVDGDELLFIMAKYRAKPQGIIGTLMSNIGLERSLVEKLNIPFKRTKVGDKYVMEALKENNWFLGGESSGHIVNLNLTTTGDGIVSALQVLGAICDTKKNLHELKSEMLKFPQILINVKATDVNLNHPKINAALKQAETTLGNTGRILVRASGTETCVRIMVEGENKKQIKTIAEGLANEIKRVSIGKPCK